MDSSKHQSSTNINRNKSINSLISLGIGQGIVNEQLNRLLKKKLDIELVKPKPENNNQQLNHDNLSTLYDCILFLIYCIEHDRFAITNVNDDHQTIWLPFVCRDGNDWSRASNYGLLSMFEKRDPDGVVVSHVNITYTMKMIELCHIQTINGRWIQRATQFVTITDCQKTCQPINSIQWMNAGNILKDDSAIWGPEFRKYLEHLEKQYSELQVVEYTIESVLRYHPNAERIDKDKSMPILSGLIKSRNISLKILTDLYEHYLRHTFPSYYMNYGSFKIYLQKCGLKSDLISLYAKYLFNCCLIRSNRDCKGSTFVDFHDICYLLLALDPELSDDNKYRQTFINDFTEQYFNDQTPTENAAATTNFNQQKKKSNQTKTKTANIKSIDTNKFQANYPPKLSRSIFTKFSKMKKKQIERLVSDKNNLTRGLCRNCRVKSFEYGQHCVMLDLMGRCVEPKIYTNADNQFVPINKLEGKKLYSAEHVFKPDSIGNILFDYLRNRKFLANNPSNYGGGGCTAIQHHQTTLLCDDENTTERTLGGTSATTGIDDVEQLDVNVILAICECTRKLLKYESKLIKRSGSTAIIGDIRSDFDTLLTMEQLYWPTIPVIAQNLVFLGNYTGINCYDNSNNDDVRSSTSLNHNHDYSIETIIYLFAIKYLCPNKVILLKGINETRAVNEKTLLVQCQKRYGEECGLKIYLTINQVFDELPLVCIINESIICTSSGIPKDSLKHKLSTYFDSYMLDSKSSSIATGNNDNNLANNNNNNNINIDNAKESTLFQHILINIPEYQTSTMIMNDTDKSPCNSTAILFRPNPSITNGFIYTREAFLQFMSLNNFSYMIRSNEDLSSPTLPSQSNTPNLMNGYYLSFDNRLITIISNIKYNQQQQQMNESIMAFVHHPDGQIQLKQLTMTITTLTTMTDTITTNNDNHINQKQNPKKILQKKS